MSSRQKAIGEVLFFGLCGAVTIADGVDATIRSLWTHLAIDMFIAIGCVIWVGEAIRELSSARQKNRANNLSTSSAGTSLSSTRGVPAFSGRGVATKKSAYVRPTARQYDDWVMSHVMRVINVAVQTVLALICAIGLIVGVRGPITGEARDILLLLGGSSGVLLVVYIVLQVILSQWFGSRFIRQFGEPSNQ